MFISNKYKVIFVHIQKTGGNSVQKVFKTEVNPVKRIFTNSSKLIRRIPIDESHNRSKHCFASDIKKSISGNVFNSYTKFCVVRNPYDRMVSWYSMIKHKTGVENQVMIEVNKKTQNFRDFIFLQKEEHKLFERFFVNQLDYISENNNVIVDDILRFENLSEDFNNFAKKINFKDTLPHVNKSIREKNYRKYYSDELREIIYERFKKDFDYFNYEF